MTWMSSVERDLMDNLVALLRDRLPRSWRIEADLWPSADPSMRVRWQVPDFRLSIYPPGGRAVRLAVEVRQSVTPKVAYEAASAIMMRRQADQETIWPSEGEDGVLLATYFLSPRARELLAETEISYADATGNIRIAVDDPPLFIETSGLDKLPAQTGRFYVPKGLEGRRTRRAFGAFSASAVLVPDQGLRIEPERALRSFKGPGAALGVRALVDYRPPYGLRELSEKAGVSLGTLSRVLDFAAGEVLIEREPRGPVTQVDWDQFIRRWAQDYSLLESNRTQLFLEPRGIDALLKKLPAYFGQYAVSGSLAAHTVAPEAGAVLAVVYVQSLIDAAEQLSLRPTDTGGNVLLVQPFPSARESQSLAPFVRTRSIDGLEYVALSQAVVDLLTSPGRGPAEAEALLTWMKANENAWRLA
jgi:hypothetical protein